MYKCRSNVIVVFLMASFLMLTAFSSTLFAALPVLANGVEGGTLAKTPLGEVVKYRYTVSGQPFDTPGGFPYGPDTWNNVYALTKQFFMVQNTNGQLGIVWQDKSGSAIHLTWLGADLLSSTTLTLPNNRNELLAAATYDSSGVVYYLTIQDGEDKTVSRTATLYKVSSTAQILAQQVLDTSANGLNITMFEGKIASLLYLNGKLGLVVDRQEHTSTDRLNHHAAIAVVFDENTLHLLKNLDRTSGHSFEGSTLIANSNGQFVAVDVGDNYPRGVNLHKFDASTRKSRVVHTFKTAHSTTPSPYDGQPSYPIYSEISGNGITYYKASNDNRTYTERAGLIEGRNSYAVVFAGEPTTDGRSLDNSRVGSYLNDPRNLGLVLVRKDFENASGSGNEVSDDLVLTPGIAESGKFYTFQGQESLQRNKGTVWLTDYRDKNQANVSRPKAVGLKDGSILLLWEKWTPTTYVNTYAMKVSEMGQKLTNVIELGTDVRLNRSDDVTVIGDKVYLIAGDKTNRKLELIILQPTSNSPTQPTYPTLNSPIAVDKNGNSTTITKAAMAGGASINGKAFAKGNNAIKTADATVLTANITPAAEHVGKPVSMFVVGGYVSNGSYADCTNKEKSTFYYLLKRSSNTYCQAPRKHGTDAECQAQSRYPTASPAGIWDGNLATLGVLEDFKNFSLTAEPFELKMWNGTFEPGVLCVWFGYRLDSDGTVVVSGESINFTITR